MKNVTIKNDCGGRYLIADVQGEIPDFEMQMIGSVAAKSMLKPLVVFEDEKICCSYNITDCWSFEDFYHRRAINADILRSIVMQINDASRILSEYLLSEKNMLLDKQCIFINKKDEALRFCIYPSANSDFAADINAFFGRLLTLIAIDDSEALRLCVSLYRESVNENCRIYDLVNAVALDRRNQESAGQPYIDPHESFVKPSSCAAGRDMYDSSREYTGVALSDLDNMETDSPEDHPKTRGKMLQYILTKVLIPQLIILIGIAVIYITRGKTIVLKVLPLYIVFSICLLIYAAGSTLIEKVKPGREGTTGPEDEP